MDILNDNMEWNRRVQLLKDAYYFEEVQDLSYQVKRIDNVYCEVNGYKVNYVANYCPCQSFHFSGEKKTCKHMDAVKVFLDRTRHTKQEVLQS